ncbi:hypothetical protein [Mesorhizobium sp. M0408]|uniref:hypothetical protein n=1 Tax=Mesorhizobium sp. M0408 TaxID=2956942 RepID=UPI00333839D3
MWPRFEDYSAQRDGLTDDISASTTFAIGPAEAGLLIYASAATLAATSETATAGPTVFRDFIRFSFVARVRQTAQRNDFIQRRGGWMFGQPSGSHDRTLQRALEIPFGHAFDRRGYRRLKASCARASRAVG